jgi:hypothetical protein
MKGGMKKQKGKVTRAHTTEKGKSDSQTARLRSELSQAISQLDKEGLLFLLRQANVLIHNARVDELNRELVELRASGATSRPAERSPGGVKIEESGDGKTLFITLGKERKVMSLPEMKQLVRICYGAESKSDALRQLYTVLVRERRDILVDAGIGGPGHPLLEGLFRAVRAKYELEER